LILAAVFQILPTDDIPWVKSILNQYFKKHMPAAGVASPDKRRGLPVHD
jgi:hypothetical protein